LAVQATQPGMRYKNGQTYVDESSVTEDGRVSSDERTMALIKKEQFYILVVLTWPIKKEQFYILVVLI